MVFLIFATFSWINTWLLAWSSLRVKSSVALSVLPRTMKDWWQRPWCIFSSCTQMLYSPHYHSCVLRKPLNNLTTGSSRFWQASFNFCIKLSNSKAPKESTPMHLDVLCKIHKHFATPAITSAKHVYVTNIIGFVQEAIYRCMPNARHGIFKEILLMGEFWVDQKKLMVLISISHLLPHNNSNHNTIHTRYTSNQGPDSQNTTYEKT